MDESTVNQDFAKSFAPAGELVVRQKKKARLLDRVGGGKRRILAEERGAAWEEDLPRRLPSQPLFCGFFGDLRSLS